MEKQYKFSKITDPENCDINELENEVERLKNLGDFYETKQLALKKFINSIYGATASKYFLAHNTDVAESITLQGQDLNHFSENAVNDYFSGIFQNDTELHKKLGIDSELAKQVTIAKGKVTETGLLEGEEFSYLKGNQSLTVAGDTDSVSGNTMINTTNDVEMEISEFFDMCKYKNGDIVMHINNGQEVVPVSDETVLTYIDHDDSAIYKPIKYIMRHKVNKPRYRITTETGKTLDVTEDHSIMVIRDNVLISIKAKDIVNTDKIITIK